MHHPTNDDESLYTRVQEALRKDMERAFGVLQSRLKVRGNELFYWYKEYIIMISYTCIILNNVLVRMNRVGLFVEGEKEEERLVDVVEELYHEEIANGNSSRQEEEEHVNTQEIKDDRNPDWEKLEIFEQSMTSCTTFLSLRNSLVRSVRELR